MIATLRKTFRSMFSWPVLILWLAAWLAASEAGPFGTYETMNLLPRVLFWGAVSGCSIALGYLGFGLAICCGARESRARQALLGTLFSTVFIVPVVWLLTYVFVSSGHGSDPGIGSLVLYTVSSIAVVAVLRWLLQEVIDRQIPDAPPEPEASPMLWQRLPEMHQRPILRLSASDHVVQVVTDAGVTELRMRFKDAVNEMDGFNGIHTHRSHWVARNAIRHARRDGGRWVVTLSNGDEIPVSRKYQPELEAAGLIQD